MPLCRKLFLKIHVFHNKMKSFNSLAYKELISNIYQGIRQKHSSKAF